MALNPLHKIKVAKTFELTPEVLGGVAYTTFSSALHDAPVTLTGCYVLHQTAKLLTITGTLSDFHTHNGIDVSVRLYLFDVASSRFAGAQRHALMLISDLPARFTVADLWTAFSNQAVVQHLDSNIAPSTPSYGSALNRLAVGGSSILTDPSFAPSLLLLSSLDYAAGDYPDAPFPPSVDKGLSSAQQAFVATLTQDGGYVVQGFTYRIQTSLDSGATITTQDGSLMPLQDAFAALNIKSIFSRQTFLAQTTFSGKSTDLALFHSFRAAIKPPSHGHFDVEFASIGLAFPLGSTTLPPPLVMLRGAVTIEDKLQFEAGFSLYAKYLTLTFTDFPSFADFTQAFSYAFHMEKALTHFLPIDDFSGLGSITLEQLTMGIDFASSSTLDQLSFTLFAEKPFSLIGGVVTLQPALIVQISDPLSADHFIEVDIFGRWDIEGAEVDTLLAVSSADSYQISAQLALGQTLNLSHLMHDVLGDQIEGIPNLSVGDFEFVGHKIGKESYYEIELDLHSGWHLGVLPLTLDEIHMEVAFANGTLSDAEISASLALSNHTFALSGNFDADNRGWTFTGGTGPGAKIDVGTFIDGLANELGVDPHNSFLKPFESIDITGFYLEYRTFEQQSSQLSLFISLVAGASFGQNLNLPLKNILVRLQTNGGSNIWRFDATAVTTPSPSTLAHLTCYIQKTYQVQVDLPESLTDLTIEELGGYHDSSLGHYGFTVYLKFGHSAQVYVQIDLIKQQNGKLEKAVGGHLVFNEGTEDELVFNLDLASAGTSTDFVAAFHGDAASSVSLAALVKAISGSDGRLQAGLSIDLRDAIFSHQQQGKTSKSIFAIDMDAGINLSALGKLPLIGSELSAAETLTLAFQIIYATDNYSKTELHTLNTALARDAAFKFPESTAITGGTPNVNAQIRWGTDGALDIDLPIKLDPSTGQLQHDSTAPKTPPAGSVTTAADGIQWLNVKKSFGPLHLERIGFKQSSAKGVEITAYLDGGLSLMGLTVDLMGLNVTTTLTGAHRFIPSFGLDGLGLDFKNGPVEIGGALHKFTDKAETEFDGLAIIRTETVQLSAVGSFAEMEDGHDSLFIYAVLDYPLGGPAFFFVTGLAAGFGYNRQLVIPPVGQLQQFPLIADATTAQPAPPTGDVSQIKGLISDKVRAMRRYIPPQVGEYFLAVGVSFTSFDLLESFALLIVQFGDHFEVDVLGISTLLVPPNVPQTPIAEAQLLLKATVIPEEGALLAQAQLTRRSYIFSRDCHLSGGYAFASWLNGPHNGDFVVSMGGYHPSFKAPSYYPQVPRVGFNWSLSSELTVKGGGYYALVPHAIMAGGSLDAVYKSHAVKAWFRLDSDFLLMWKPFHYDARLNIDIGAELTIHFFGTHHISVDASADMHLWGPDFGGHAHVSVKVIGIKFHFSVDFGASTSLPDPISWADFAETFLPETDKMASLSVNGGLERTIKDRQGHDLLLINPKEFSIVTNSVLPIKSVTGSFSLQTGVLFGVAPMDKRATQISQAEHKVTFSGKAGSELAHAPVTKPLPSALWGEAMDTELNPKQPLILDAIVGIRIYPAQASRPGAAITVGRDQLMYDTTTKDDGFQWNHLSAFTTTQPQAPWDTIQTAILSAATVKTRNELLQNLGIDPSALYFNQAFANDAVYPPLYGN